MKNIFLLIFVLSTVCFPFFGQKIFNDSIPVPRPGTDIVDVVYLIGDVGADPGKQAGIRIMKPMMDAEPESHVAVLGDNIYPLGLHDKSHPLRKRDEERIDYQLDAMKGHKGEVIFIPGNHDWDQSGRDGRNMVRRQQKYVEAYLGEDDNFMPDNGCPGPKVEQLGDLTIIAIDTQWWIHPYERSVGEADKCDVLDEEGFMVEFNEALKKNRNKHVLVIGHHPLKSNGEHGGRYAFKDHIFPLTAIDEKWKIPLPVIGSIYPLYRKLLGDRQDIQHPINRNMVNALLTAMGEYENVVYANGHEHNLQYFPNNGNHLVVSGAGAKVTHLANTREMEFGAQMKGFSRLTYYKNGDVWLEFYGVGPDEQAQLLYSKRIYNKMIPELKEPEDVPFVDYSGMTAIVVGDSAYMAKGTKRFLMGDLNRELWLRPIEVPYLDIHQAKGGLTPVKVGGGMQTKSLRLEGGDGHQYVVRQIRKSADYLVEKELRNTVAQNVIYDGIAGSHPYAAIAIPRLSEPLGIYHTDPSLVYLPDDPILGDMRDDFGGTFCLFEIRPDDGMSDIASVGNSEEVVSYSDLIENVHSKKGHSVDQRFTLRNRLFDMLIGDWDRHDDQWRWASFKEDGNTIYRPVPRDRDQAFFHFDGLLPTLANRKWTIRKFQTYDTGIRDIIGQNFNGRFFDRSWLNEMDKEDWMAEAGFISTHLSDADIDAAIGLFPQAAQDFDGEELKTILRARRDDMAEIAADYYKVISKVVDVVGKTKDDYFEVIRQEDGKVEVNIYPEKGGGARREDRYYHRVFDRKDTKEIRIYGLDGKDVYDIQGDVKRSILVRIIGGEEQDEVRDASRVKGISKMCRYYDDTDQKHLPETKETRVLLSPPAYALQYDRKSWKYGAYLPFPYVGYNPTDDVYLGAGLSWTTFGFDKEPFKSEQMFRGNVATGTGAFNLEYDGLFVDRIGPFDLGLRAELNRPLIFFFNGLGNETVEIERVDAQARFDRLEVAPYLSISSRSGSSMLKLLTGASGVRFDDDDALLDTVMISTRGKDDLFWKVGLEYSYMNLDDEISPWRGIRFSAGLENTRGFEDEDDIDFLEWRSSLALYFPMGFMPSRTTLALRGAVKHIDGRANFFQSAFIGGQEEFRGVLRNRYAGNTAQYNNVELRADIAQIKNSALPFRFGIMGHYDLGRVWLDGEDSDTWHNSFGGGVYLNILGSFSLNATYSVADDGDAILVQGGFFF